jgi:hypothetical protein
VRDCRAIQTAHYFATMAHLEAASVVAFANMVTDLREHRAPEELIARAHSAIAERDA